MKLVRIVLLCSWLAMAISALHTTDFAKPIKLMLVQIDEPLKVQVMVCWNFDQRYQFVTKFHSEYPDRDYQLAITKPKISFFPNVIEEHQYMIVVDLACEETQELLIQVGQKLSQRFKWAMMNSTLDHDVDIDAEIQSSFEFYPVLINSAVYFLHRSKHQTFVIKQVYRVSPATEVLIELFGLYRDGKMDNYQSTKISTQRRRNLNRFQLRATMVVTDNNTLNHLDDYGDKHIDTITKVNYILTNYLMLYVNATIKYAVANSWGYLNKETGKWSGMIGDLVENVSDIGASAMFLTSDRIAYIEFIAMPTPTSSKFVFRQPKLSFTDNAYILPFDRFVWYCVIGLVLVVTIFLGIATKAEKKISGAKESLTDACVLRPSILDIAILVVGAACQQGSPVTPRSATARIIMLITFTSLMFLYAGYSAYIVALLQSPSNKIRTLEDLLNSRLKFGVDDTVFNRYYFQHSTEPIRRKIYEQRIVLRDGSENFMKLEDGVARLREGLFAFHMELGVGYKVISETFLEDEKCGLQEIKYLQVADETWYAIQKNSSFKELLKTGMMRLHEFGIQNRENAAYYTKKPKCSGGGGKFITVGLVDTRSAMLILIWGFIASFVLLMIEMASVKHRKYHKRNTQENKC